MFGLGECVGAGVCDVAWFEEPHGFGGVFESLFGVVVGEVVEEFGVDEARCDDGDADAELGGFCAESFGERVYEVFGSAVDGAGWEDSSAGDGGDVDDVAVALFDEVWEKCVCGVEDAVDVDIDHLFPVFDFALCDGGVWHVAGVVDEDVDVSEVVDGFFDG